MPGGFLRRKIDFDRWAKVLVCGAFALLVYILTLSLSIPQQVGVAFRYGSTCVLVLLGGLLYFAYRLPGWIGSLFGLSVTVVIFALPLSGLWGSSVRDSFVLGSLLPIGDATRFYLDAVRLGEGWLLSSSAWRPLYPGLLSGLLFITGQNLQMAFAGFGFLSAAACYLLSREVQRTHGAVAGTAVMALLFLYYRRFSGLAMTEGLSLILGALGFAFLWRGAWQKGRVLIMAGILMTTLALITRPGAYIMLPLLVFWAGWVFRKEKKVSLPVIGMSAAMVLMGFVANNIIGQTLSPPDVGRSNFPLTIYGQVSGGMGWDQIYKDHPETAFLGGPEHSRTIYSLTRQAFYSDPLGIVRGSLKAWGAFFSVSRDGIFGFVGKEGTLSTLVLRLFLFSLGALGLAACRQMIAAREQREAGLSPELGSLVLAAVLGVVLSVPFVPPWDGSGMRLYAANAVLYGILPALGAALIVRMVKPLAILSGDWQPLEVWTLPAFAGFLAAAVMMGPLAVYALSRLPVLPPAACPAGKAVLYTRLNPGSYIIVVADRAVPRTRLPHVRISEFKKSNHDFGSSEIAAEFDNIQAPMVVSNVMNLETGKDVILMVGEDRMPPVGEVAAVCGEWSKTANLKDWFFHGESVPVD